MIKVHSDITAALESGSMAALIMIDMSAAFDTINHRILLDRLQQSFGITGTAHMWFESYLTGRTQSVLIEGHSSEPVILTCSVPQGSVLGPKKYCAYVRPIGRIVTKFGLIYHCYADDTQLYIILQSKDSWSSTVRPLEDCLREIQLWMESNQLKMNDEKTEFIVFTSRSRKVNTADLSLTVGQTTVAPTPVVKNLGSLWDDHMNMDRQIGAMCRSGYFQLRSIARIRDFITRDACRTLIQSRVISKLDYGNAILSGLPGYLIERLQKVQNQAARLIDRLPKTADPDLAALHMLPVATRIKFKIILYVFKCLNSRAPTYLSDILTVYRPRRHLRSEESLTLVVPKYDNRYGRQNFKYAAADLWNGLPHSLRVTKDMLAFRRQLKTHLFKSAF